MLKTTTVSICLAAALSASMAGCTSPDSGDVSFDDDLDISPQTAYNLPNATIGAAVAKTTVYSGDGPTDETFGKAVSTNQALTGFRAWEDSDEPCKIEGAFGNVETGVDGSSLSINRCDGHTPGSLKSALLPDGYFVTEARVCLNSAGDKIKGISVGGNVAECIAGASTATVMVEHCSWVQQGGMEIRVCNDEEEEVACADLETSSYFERTNCQGDNDGPDGDWENTVFCNAGQVVTRVNFGTTNESGAKESFKGIQLECHDLLN